MHILCLREIPHAFTQGLSVIFALHTILIKLGYAISKSITVDNFPRNSLAAERCGSVVGNMRTEEEKGKEECPGIWGLCDMSQSFHSSVAPFAASSHYWLVC